MDWEREAISFSEKNLKEAPSNFHIKFKQEDLIRFIGKKKYYQESGKPDLIYSIGIADYFTDRILRRLIANSVYGLRKGGRFVIARKDKIFHFRVFLPSGFATGSFFQRNEKDLLGLIESLHLEKIEVKVIEK